MTGFTVPNHTQTPNDLFDKYMKDMTEAELKVTLAVIRKTLGYHKQTDPISWSQIMSMSGLSKDAVQNGIDRALERGLIEIVGHGKRGVNIFGLVLNPDQSEINTSSGTNKIPDEPLTGTKLRHTKETGNKEIETKSAGAPSSIKLPRSISSYTAAHVLAYQALHTADMTALVHAWEGTMYNSITEFSTKIGRLYIETHIELSRLNKSCAEYLAIANHTKKKDAWKDTHKVTDMLLYLTDYKPQPSKVIYDDPLMDLNIPQPEILSVFQQAEANRKARENHG